MTFALMRLKIHNHTHIYHNLIIMTLLAIQGTKNRHRWGKITALGKKLNCGAKRTSSELGKCLGEWPVWLMTPNAFTSQCCKVCYHISGSTKASGDWLLLARVLIIIHNRNWSACLMFYWTGGGERGGWKKHSSLNAAHNCIFWCSNHITSLHLHKTHPGMKDTVAPIPFLLGKLWTRCLDRLEFKQPAQTQQFTDSMMKCKVRISK